VACGREVQHKTKFGMVPNKTPNKSGLAQKEKDNGHLTKKKPLML